MKKRSSKLAWERMLQTLRGEYNGNLPPTVPYFMDISDGERHDTWWDQTAGDLLCLLLQKYYR